MKNSESRANSPKRSKKAAADNISIAVGITNTTRESIPRLPFLSMAKAILKDTRRVSLVFIGDQRALSLNEQYRQKSTPANVLSFPLGGGEGEIFLNLERARREAPEFGSSYRSHLGFLFIHGLLHLEGFDHGATMESIERKVRKRFKLTR